MDRAGRLFGFNPDDVDRGNAQSVFVDQSGWRVNAEEHRVLLALGVAAVLFLKR